MSKTTTQSIPSTLGSLVEIALQIAEERANILGQMKAAILANDDQLALGFAKQLCGLNDEQVTH